MASKMRARQSQSMVPRALVIILFFGAIVVGSWGQYAITDPLNLTSQVAQAQMQDYAAMQWLKVNTPNNSQYISISDWNFIYTNLTIGRNSIFEYARTPADAVSLAVNATDYIIVTNVATLSLGSLNVLYPWANFPNSSTSQLKLIYSNPNVKIFQTANSTA